MHEAIDGAADLCRRGHYRDRSVDFFTAGQCRGDDPGNTADAVLEDSACRGTRRVTGTSDHRSSERGGCGSKSAGEARGV